MREAIKENKKTILISSLIILLLIIGITFAYLITTINGEKEYIVKAKELELKLEEENELTLNNEIPIEDSEGLSRDGFKFSLKNNGKDDYEYTIYLDDLPLEEGENRIPDSAIRYSLDRNETVGVAKDLESMGVNPNRVVDSGEIGSSETINYTLRLWLDYDATNEEAGGKVFKGKLRVEVTMLEGDPVSDVIVDNVGENGSTYDDGTDTFITGTDPNNYIWYSGKLWRAVSVNNEAKTTKLVTQWNISAINYNVANNNAAFEGSYMEDWLNDTSVDGFLYNLRDYENFIETNAKWDASTDANKLGSIKKPNGTTIVEDAVGLLNMYEYQSSNNGGTDGYLNNGIDWWTLTPHDSFYVCYVEWSGSDDYNGNLNSIDAHGVRPSINLKSSVKIVSGDGTIDNPYRLAGDNDTNLSGTLLSTRYSGEYIKFGNAENNLYRIVSHENGIGTKITSAEPLKNPTDFITSSFGTYPVFSSTNTIGTFLNGKYLNSYVDIEYREMIEDSTIWYRGRVGKGESYKLAKYKDVTGTVLTSNTTNAKVGLLRFGELMAGQFDIYNNNMNYWILTSYSSYGMRFVNEACDSNSDYGKPGQGSGIRPSMNLKENVIITSGDGTKNNPFTIELSS